MRTHRYLSANRFHSNSIASVDFRTVDFREVERLVDDSYFVPSTEAVKRIRNLGNQSLEAQYDSALSLQTGITPHYVRHPSRDIVEVMKFTKALYDKVEKSLQGDISEAQRKSLEKQKTELEKTKIHLAELEKLSKDDKLEV